jgi:hypothetical protein
MEQEEDHTGTFAFRATLDIIGINPFVPVPLKILKRIFKTAGKDRGFIPVCGTVNDKPYTQTLVKFKDAWRLYINTKMLPRSPKRIGEAINVTIRFDKTDRTLIPHPLLLKALRANPPAKEVFDKLAPSRRKEIIRYISSLKSMESIERNVKRAIGFLNGSERFVGRDRP